MPGVLEEQGGVEAGNGRGSGRGWGQGGVGGSEIQTKSKIWVLF